VINREVARIFNELADILEVKGENPFRVRAYRRAAQNIEAYPKNVAEASPKDLQEIPGIGADLAGKIREIAETGALQDYERLKKEVPAGFTALLAVPGLGPRTAKRLMDELGVGNLEDLERAAMEHRVAGLKGMGEKTEENILKGIGMLRKGRERKPIGRVRPLADAILRELRQKAPVKELAVAGSIRRWKDTIKDIDLLSTSDDPQKVMNVFVRLPQVKEVLMKGPTKSSVILEEMDIQVDLRVVEEKSLGAALAYFTGSKAHNIRLREMAAKAGLKLNEYGVFREKDDRRLGGRTEEEVYRILGLPFIPPELREDAGEIEAALKGELPRLVELGDIRGDLHVHTSRTDGSHTVEELARAAKARGYKYLAVTDHSKGLAVARGLNENQLEEQMGEIDALNRKLRGFRVLKGVEVDIKSDNTLDLPDSLLRKLDVVVASIHSGFGQPRDKLTRRLLSAIENPLVSIIAHPTGRLIGEREAYDVDIELVLREAAKNGTAVEINAYPDRLDLKDVHVKTAREAGTPIAISTDTHKEAHFDYMGYGVGVARRGWLEKKDVINTRDLKPLMAFLRKKRK